MAAMADGRRRTARPRGHGPAQDPQLQKGLPAPGPRPLNLIVGQFELVLYQGTAFSRAENGANKDEGL
jgi:hypothetical protein